MLVTRQPVLRRFWYPVMPAAMLAAAPRAFRLLGTDIVLWRAADGAVNAVRDRCCHRSARLSCGFVENGAIVCGYHGWTFDGSGACIRIPQRAEARKIAFGIPGYRAAERYGHVWVCLGEPLHDIPDFPEEAAGHRRIDQFYEVWRCAGLRLMENSFDNAHVAFVHRATFGDVTDPKPAPVTITENATGFETRAAVPVVNRGLGAAVTRSDGATTVRHINAFWYMPFLRKLGMTYPSGQMHTIVTCATPIDDESSQIVQFVYRNDTEADTKAADIIAFDRKVTLEDQAILESTDSDVPLDQASGEEFHMPSDQPGLIMRRRLRALLADHGEIEVRRGAAPASAAADQDAAAGKSGTPGGDLPGF